MNAKTAEPICITKSVPECAAELGVSTSNVVRWIEGGHLQAFVAPGKAIGDSRPGPKDYRVFARDWEAFMRARTMTGPGVAPTPTTPAPTPRPTIATGTDGVSRRKRRRG